MSRSDGRSIGGWVCGWVGWWVGWWVGGWVDRALPLIPLFLYMMHKRFLCSLSAVCWFPSIYRIFKLISNTVRYGWSNR